MVQRNASQIGGDEEVGWIAARTEIGVSITSAVPAVFDSYATLFIPDDDESKRRSDTALVALLSAHSFDQTWWLRYLETEASDVVFSDSPAVRLYSDRPTSS